MRRSDSAFVEFIALSASIGLGITLYPGQEGAPIVLFNPAMGVRASFYEAMAKALQREGFNAATADLRGLGLSTVKVSRGVDFGYREIVEEDLPAIVEALRELWGRDNKLVIFGHSLGGQLACLHASAARSPPDALVLVACCSVYWRSWDFPLDFGILLFEQIARLTAEVVGYFPGHLFRFGKQEAKRLTRDWAHQGFTGRYEPEGSGIDYEARMRELKIPVLALSFTDDWYAPEAAVRHLLDKMPLARREHRHLTPQSLGAERMGHFPWAKQPELIAPRLAVWIRDALR